MIDARHWRRIAVAAAVSGAAHAAVMALGRLDLPEPPEERLPLAVRIVTAPQGPAPTLDSAPPRTPAAKSRAPKNIARIDSAPAVRVVERGDTSVSAGDADTPAPAGDAVAIAETVPDNPAPPLAEPIVVATAPASTYTPEPPPLRSLPRKGRITYNLLYGQFPVGKTVQTWEMNDGIYRLASRSETTGIVDLVRSQHRTYFSSGALTRDGLRPQTFLMSRNRGRGTEEARAQFDWEAATVTLGPASARRSETLPPRSQDILSFVYQLSLDPPQQPGRMRHVVTNGSRIETYDLDVLPEETIETPLGTLRALPLRQVRKGAEETIALWLATEYRYLPVRVRFYNREGEAQGEQVVTEIRLSDD